MSKRSDRFIASAESIGVVTKASALTPPVAAANQPAFRVFAKPADTQRPEFLQVGRLADEIRAYLALAETRSVLSDVHVAGTSSQAVQQVLNRELGRLGFESEKTGLFPWNTRPDYYRAIGKSGVIIEVERGKTIENNMDLLDLWKCHLCAGADYLFLIVPVRRPSKTGATTRVFERVCGRLGPFFEAPNFVNVDAVFVFGY